MKVAINLINFGPCGEAAAVAELAAEAEQAGWDGLFIWDHIAFGWPEAMVDPWVALTAAAMRTERIMLGTMITPLPRRRPWKLARETASLQALSGGRLILGVGLGVLVEEFDHLGEESDQRVRGAMLDEALDVLRGLWSGEPFSYDGAYYTVQNAHFLPKPVPPIPIWVGGAWPNKKPFRRAARFDGAFPIVKGGGPQDTFSVADVRDILAYIAEYRTTDAPFDLTIQGATPGSDPQASRAITQPYAEAGVTWWQEAIHGLRDDMDGTLAAFRERIRQGPPQ